jgi:hypothetical protein
MVEPDIDRHRFSPRVRALAAAMAGMLAATPVALAGCSAGSGSESGAACAAPSPAPPAEMVLLPAGLSFDQIGTVTHVERTGGHITMQAVTTKPLDESTVLIQDAVTGAGYRPAGMDSEESEAEVFFSSGTTAAGQARVWQAECKDLWNIDLSLVEPNAVPALAGPSTTT